MGPRFSTLYDSSARTHQSPVTASTEEVQPSVVRVESKPGYDGSRQAWASASRRHVALLDTIRAKTSRSRRAPSKPAVAAGEQLHQHGPAAAASSSTADKRVWAKLIARLSRKMGASRLSSSRSSAQQPSDSGVELGLHQGPGAGGGLIRGTSSVLPVSRNPVTKTVAYNDDNKHQCNDNNNLPADDFASRVSRRTSMLLYEGVMHRCLYSTDKLISAVDLLSILCH